MKLRLSRIERGVWAIIALHFLLMLAVGLSRHWGYVTSLNDLGVFDQAVWGVLHGQSLLNTTQLNQPINWLGFHFNPVLLLFVPLYALAPWSEWFTLAQALALSVAAWPIYLLAKRLCESETAGVLWVVAYLANPFLLNAEAWDFHPVSLAVPCIAYALLAIEETDRRLLLFSCLPLLLIQEQLGLTVAMIGLLWGLRNGQWKVALGMAMLGIAHAVLVLGVVMPHFSPAGVHPMVAGNMGHLSRYGWLGKSTGEIVLSLVSHPWDIAREVLVERMGWAYLALLLIPVFGFALAAPLLLLPALPDLAANLLSSNPMPRSVFAYHSVTLIPVFVAAAIHGARRISRGWSWLSCAQVSGLATLLALAAGYSLAPLPLPGAADLWAQVRPITVPEPGIAAIRAAAGDASLSVQGNVGAHFSQRSRIYVYPSHSSEVDAIILRLESPTRKVYPAEVGNTASLASHLQMRPAAYLASIECMLASGNYGVTLWNDPWLILKREKAMPAERGDHSVMRRLEQLRHDWKIDAEEYREEASHCRGT